MELFILYGIIHFDSLFYENKTLDIILPLKCGLYDGKNVPFDFVPNICLNIAYMYYEN